MIIAGARGLARELAEVLAAQNKINDLYFFDNVSEDAPDLLMGRFPVLRSVSQLAAIFGGYAGRNYALGLGNPLFRYRLNKLFTEAGGILTSIISKHANIGVFQVSLGQGCTILPGTVITTHAELGMGCLLNPNATISHDVVLGDFVELSPGASVTGNCRIGNFTSIGTRASILPKITIGENVIVGAGAVVTRDVPDNCVVAGVPARIIRKIAPLAL